MYVKNILKAFNRNTEIEVYCEEPLEDLKLEYKTVGEFMDNGLMTYTCIDEKSLTIENDKIIICLCEEDLD